MAPRKAPEGKDEQIMHSSARWNNNWVVWWDNLWSVIKDILTNNNSLATNTDNIIWKTGEAIKDIFTANEIIDEYTIQRYHVNSISTNEKAFQNRKAKFSDTSVKWIITAVIEDTFLWHMCDPIRIRHNPEDWKLYVVAWHSRLEAFRRIANDPILLGHPNVQKFWQKLGKWLKVPTIILPKELTFEEAKFIAIMSNTLASYESDTERAYYYYELRKLNRLTKEEMKARFEKFEKGNALTIESFSYLNPYGHVISTIDQFELSQDNDKVLAKIKKCAYWTGIARMKRPELSNVHEKEIFDWLFKWMYGKWKWQISTFDVYRETLSTHIKQVKELNDGVLDPNKHINIAKTRSLSNAEKAQIEMEQDYINLLRELNKEINHDIYRYQNVIKKWDWATLFNQLTDKRTELETDIKHAIAHFEQDWEKIYTAIQNGTDQKIAMKWHKARKAVLLQKLKELRSLRKRAEEYWLLEQTLF